MATYNQMMIAFEFAFAFFALVTENLRMHGVAMCAQNVRRFERLVAQIAMEIPFLEMRIPMVDHVALRSEPFAAHIAHILSYVFVASYVRR